MTVQELREASRAFRAGDVPDVLYCVVARGCDSSYFLARAAQDAGLAFEHSRAAQRGPELIAAESTTVRGLNYADAAALAARVGGSAYVTIDAASMLR